jgi:rhamnosyltransferase
MKYRQHSQNDTGARASYAGIRKRLGLIRSGWYSRQLNHIANLCSAAAPDHTVVARWLSILSAKHGVARRAQLLSFLLTTGGRRRPADNFVMGAAACVGWI